MQRTSTDGRDSPSFAETALRLGGKGDDEARRLAPWTGPTSRSRRCTPSGGEPRAVRSIAGSGMFRSRWTCSNRRH